MALKFNPLLKEGLDNSGSSGGSGSTSPGGSNTQVQFNDAGAFGGDAGLIYNKTTSVLSVGSGIVVGTTSPFTDLAGSLRLNGIAALDAQTKTTIESAITTLANLTSVQGQAVSLSGSLTVPAIASVSGTNTGDQTLAGLGGVPTSRTITAGAGLTGGGDLTTDKTIDVGAGTGITVNANDIALTVPVVIANGGTNSTAALNNSRVMTSVGGAIVESGTIADGDGIQRNNTTFISAPLPLNTVEGRLTLTSGTPITTADVTGATTIYFTPYKGNRIYLYDGTRWKLYSFTELSLALGTLTNALPYDVFIYDNAGTLTLELLAWTNGTTRATALTTQNGVLVKSGATTRRYLGTFYTTATTTTEDSGAKRLLWNYYNRTERKLKRAFADASHTYGTASWRSWNNSTAERVEVVVGWAEIIVDIFVRGGTLAAGATDYGVVGVNRDGTSTNDADLVEVCYGNTTILTAMFSQLKDYPPVGYHYYQATEYATTGTNITFYGTFATPQIRTNGIIGTIEG